MSSTDTYQMRIPTRRARMLEASWFTARQRVFRTRTFVLSAKMRLEAVLLGETFIVRISLACFLRNRAQI